MQQFIKGFKSAWEIFPDLTDLESLGVVVGCLSFGICGMLICFGFATLMGKRDQWKRAKEERYEFECEAYAEYDRRERNPNYVLTHSPDSLN